MKVVQSADRLDGFFHSSARTRDRRVHGRGREGEDLTTEVVLLEN